MDRRSFLKIGLSGIASLGWNQNALAAPSAQRKKLILIWLGGGHAATESFDPKPNSPEEVRGPFKAIQTSVPGLHFSELLPNLAERAHKLAVFRAVTVRNGDHYNASNEILHDNSEKQTLAERAGRGAMVPYMLCEVQPPYSYIESAHRGDWMKIEYRNGRYCPPALTLEEPISARRKLLDSLESNLPGTSKYASQREAALALLLGGGPLQACFEISIHDRLRYGGSSLGECLLLAKRLTEAGVGAVTVISEQDGGWDLHYKMFERHRVLASALDSALARLMDALNDDTICLVCSEFGRTPKINSNGGRDHWPQANTALLFGGGIRPCVIGRTDSMLLPKERPVPAPMLCKTVLQACRAGDFQGNEVVSEVIG